MVSEKKLHERDMIHDLQAGDQRWVRTAGSALHLLHSLYGPFSKIYGIGRCSKVQYDHRPKTFS